jgi:sugar/nucleoside kinase (ribokinase family)
MSHDVSVVGPLNIDLLIRGAGPPNWESIPTWDGPADMEMAAAGSVGYTVQNLARLGLSVSVSSCLPDDPLGLFIESALQRAGVDTSLVQTIPDTLGGIGAYMLLFGSRKRPLAYRLPTHPLWSLDYAPEVMEALLDSRLFHSGGYLHFKEAWHGALRDLYKAARERGLITTMDPQFPLFTMEPPWMGALEDVLPYLDILMCDEDEARGITAETDLATAARRLHDAGCDTIIVKRGATGSTVYKATMSHFQPAVVLGELVDSIGAGDTYDAGIIYGTLQGWQIERKMLFASIAAGFSVLGAGGTESMPDLETILAEMQK